MAFSLNRAQLIGNVTRAPEVRVAGTQKVATFGVATNFSWKDKMTGERKDKAEFHNVVAWGKLAEICEQYIKKGSKIYVEGRMQTRDWEGEDGVKRYRSEIVAENIIMLDKKGEMPMDGAYGGSEEAVTSSFQAARAPQGLKSESSEGQKVVAEKEISIDDLPF